MSIGIRRAFNFIGSTVSCFDLPVITGMPAVDVPLLAAEAVGAVVGAASKFGQYCCERRNTAELRSQVESQKAALDAMVSQYRRRTEIEIEEYYKRMNMELDKEKRSLDTLVETYRLKLEHMEKVSRQEQKKYFDRLKENEDLRKGLLRTMAVIEEIMVEAEKDGLTDNKYFAQLNERYRACVRNYSNYIKQVV